MADVVDRFYNRAIDIYEGNEQAMTPIEDLNLPLKLNRKLRRNGIRTVAQLCRMTHERLLILRGIGDEYATQILKAVEVYRHG